MFWSIFFSSLVLILAIMVVGQLIASFVEKKSEGKAEHNSEGEE
jgi:hypothetical protein